MSLRSISLRSISLPNIPVAAYRTRSNLPVISVRPHAGSVESIQAGGSGPPVLAKLGRRLARAVEG
jgi:hypothetical protein